MSKVSNTGYLRLGAPDLAEWRTFGTNVLGLQEVDRPDSDGSLSFRMDQRGYRLEICEGDDSQNAIGFEVATADALTEVAKSLRESGHEVEDLSETAAHSRGARAAVACTDPGGLRVEFVEGLESAREAFVSPTGVEFVTGTMGFGHVFALVPDVSASLAFYRDTLGFSVSDTIDVGPTVAWFLRCNRRHHSFALAEMPGLERTTIQHFMLEVDSLEMVGRAYDSAGDDGARLSTTLGMHTNDRVVSFYVSTPSGCDVEYGCDGLEVDDSVWTTTHYDATSFWGHKPVMPNG